MCLKEPANSLGSWQSKLNVGNGEKRRPGTQRLQSVTNGSFLEAQFSSFTYRSAVADGACIGP